MHACEACETKGILFSDALMTEVRITLPSLTTGVTLCWSWITPPPHATGSCSAQFAAWASYGTSREHMLSSMPHAHFPGKESKCRYDFGREQEGAAARWACWVLLGGALSSSSAD